MCHLACGIFSVSNLKQIHIKVIDVVLSLLELDQICPLRRNSETGLRLLANNLCRYLCKCHITSLSVLGNGIKNTDAQQKMISKIGIFFGIVKYLSMTSMRIGLYMEMIHKHIPFSGIMLFEFIYLTPYEQSAEVMLEKLVSCF